MQVSALWLYALNNTNVLQVRDILRVIHLLPRDYYQEDTASPEIKRSREKINKLLKQQYEFQRLPTTNIYEMYDEAALIDHYREEYPCKQSTETLNNNVILHSPQIDFIKFRKALETDLADSIKPANFTEELSLAVENDSLLVQTTRTKRMPRIPKQEGPILIPPNLSIVPGVFLRDEETQPSFQLTVPIDKIQEKDYLQDISMSLQSDPFKPFISQGFLSTQELQSCCLSSYERFESKFDRDNKPIDKKATSIKPAKVDIPKFKEDLPNNPYKIKIPISYRLFDSLYESLLYCPNLKFALQAAQLTYALSLVKFDQPLILSTINNTNPQYYVNRKNQLFCEFIETLHQRRRELSYQQTITLEGLVVQVNSKSYDDMLAFTPKEPDYALDRKISKKLNTSEFGEMQQIAPGEFGILEEVSDSSEKKYICCIKECQPLRIICPFFRATQSIFVKFSKLLNRKVFDRANSALSNVSRKNMAVLGRGNIHLVWQYPSCNTSFVHQVVIDWTRVGHTVLITGRNIDQHYDILIAMGLSAVKVTQKMEEKAMVSSKPQIFCANIQACTADLFKNISFTRAMILQANSIPEHTSLLALAKGCKKAVLIGDTQQPSPLIVSALAISKGSAKSLFQRLLEEGYPLITYSDLCTLHGPFLCFLNEHFYNGRLRHLQALTLKPLIKGFPWPSSQLRFCFLQCNGKQQQFSHSVINLVEAETCVRIVASVFEAGFTSLSQIEVVVISEKQRRLVLYLLYSYFQMSANANKDFRLPVEDISGLCSVVGEHQHLSKELIIFSCCHRNSRGWIGRLSDQRRLNAFLCRARQGLIVIGDARTLIHNPVWRDLLSWAISNRLILQEK